MGIGNIGWSEFLLILAIALIFFGPRRLPGIAQAIGRSLREFQKALNEVKSEFEQAGRQADTRNELRSLAPRPAEVGTSEPEATKETERPRSERPADPGQGADASLNEESGEPASPKAGATDDSDPQDDTDAEHGDLQRQDLP